MKPKNTIPMWQTVFSFVSRFHQDGHYTSLQIAVLFTLPQAAKTVQEVQIRGLNSTGLEQGGLQSLTPAWPL